MRLSRETKVKAAMKTARTRLVPFVQFCDERYEPGMFHYSLAHQLEAAHSRQRRRLIIATPPQHGKSTLTSIYFPAFILGRNPRARVICASYAADLAERNSQAARDIIEENEMFHALFPSVKVSRKKRALDCWQTEQKGYVKGVGVGGGLTGFSADVLIIDDPFKDWQEACSAAARNRVWNWFLTVAMTRLHPDGAVIIVNTRWNTRDLVGMLQDPQRVETMRATVGEQEVFHGVKYRAISRGDSDDPLKRKEGEALWPERYTRNYLEATKANLTPKHWAALYDQDPVPLGGGAINTQWFNVVSPGDVPSGLRWFRFWDLATTEDTKADFTASLACAIDGNGVAWIRDGVWGQWQWPTLRERIKVTAHSEQQDTRHIGVEAVAGFKSAFQNLREGWDADVSLQEINASRDKLSRTDAWTPAASQGKINLVAGSWVTEFLNQCGSFPEGDNDDFVDALSGAYAMAKSGTGFASTVPERRERGFNRADRRVLV